MVLSDGYAPREILKTFLLVLAPYAPHLAEEAWERLGGEGLLAVAPWPEHQEALGKWEGAAKADESGPVDDGSLPYPKSAD